MQILKRINFLVLALFPICLCAMDSQDVTLRNKIDSYITAQVGLGQFNGAILVAREGKIILSKGYGNANAELQIPCTPQTQFCIGSVTKPFTALMIMMLQKQGKLSVKDNIDTYFPDFPHGKKITIHQLLTHSSGIIDYLNIKGVDKKLKLPFTEYQGKPIKSLSFEELIAIFKDEPLTFTPGEKMSYSNSNYVLLGSIIEKVSGKTFEQFLKENIFEPFNMQKSGINYYATVRPNQTLSYYFYPSMPADFDLSGAGDGSIYSTVEDLYNFDKKIKTVDSEILKQIHTPWFDYDRPNAKVGYGWIIDKIEGHKRISHGGGINGFVSLIAQFPDDDICIIFCCNVTVTACPFVQISDDVTALVFTGSCNRPHKTWWRRALQWGANHSLSRYIIEKALRRFA